MSENIYRGGRSESSSQSQITASQWVDQPRPSIGFICFCLIFPLFLLIVLAGTLIDTASSHIALSIGVESIVFALLFVGFVAIFGFILRIGYRIKYELDEYTLHLYSGKRVTFSIPFYQVSEVRKTRYNRRLLGWGLGDVGQCNRFSNGVCLTVTRGRTSYKLYISPSNPDEFLERLNALRVNK